MVGLFFRPKFQGISPQTMALDGTLTPHGRDGHDGHGEKTNGGPQKIRYYLTSKKIG